MPACGQAVGCGVSDTPGLAWRHGPACACTRVCWCCQIFTYIHTWRAASSSYSSAALSMRASSHNPSYTYRTPHTDSSTLAFTRHYFTYRLLCTNQLSLYCPSHLYRPHGCNTIALLLHNIQPPSDPPFSRHTPYNIVHSNIL